MSRPEHSKAPEDFYNESEAAKYAVSTRMMAVQKEITSRAVELLNLPPNESHLLLDIGCGSGLSGEVLTKHGHTWIGMDISSAMLNEAKNKIRKRNITTTTTSSSSSSSSAAVTTTSSMEDDEEDDDDDDDEDEFDDELNDDDDDDDNDDDNNPDMEMIEEDDDDNPKSTKKQSPAKKGSGDFLLNDMGNGLGFRPNTFDGCISISAVQWLCYSHRADQIPHKRLRAFFSSLYACLRRGARAAIQLYPETPEQMEMISNAAMSAGFTGGVVVDYPNSTKAKKYYLVLFAGTADKQKKQTNILPEPRGVATATTTTSSSSRQGGYGGGNEIDYERSRNTKRGHQQQQHHQHRNDDSSRVVKRSRTWIERKKETQRRQGKDVRPDSKYTGRKRSGKLW
jgi:18S rRNA (guanine1575-N7)-methyltransferase